MDSDVFYRIVPAGLEINLKVTPKARQNKIFGPTPQGLKIQITAVPEKGRANEAVIALMADLMDIAKTSITLLSGETSKQKKLLIAGDGAALLARLQRAL